MIMIWGWQNIFNLILSRYSLNKILAKYYLNLICELITLFSLSCNSFFVFICRCFAYDTFTVLVPLTYSSPALDSGTVLLDISIYYLWNHDKLHNLPDTSIIKDCVGSKFTMNIIRVIVLWNQQLTCFRMHCIF